MTPARRIISIVIFVLSIAQLVWGYQLIRIANLGMAPFGYSHYYNIYDGPWMIIYLLGLLIGRFVWGFPKEKVAPR